MKLDHYISELLFKHDCVIVPGLGGFITNYKPASIQPIKNTLSPPSKGLSFNKNLVNNDGLLANHIAESEGISYDDACKQIKEYITEINTNLRLKRRALLDDIGRLYVDKRTRKVLFEPDTKINYALDSYGLSTIQSSPIKEEGEQVEEKIIEEKVEEKTKKEEPIVVEEKILKIKEEKEKVEEKKVLKKEKEKVAEKKITKKSENLKTPTPPPVVEQGELQDSGVEKKRSKKWMVAAAILILIASGTGWVAYQNNFALPDHLNYADLNPFKKSNESSIFSLRSSYPEYAVIEEESIKAKMIAAEEVADSEYLEVSFVKEPETPTFAELKPKPVAVSKKTPSPSATSLKNNSSLKFHIIGGCFSKKSNAERLVKKLQKKGFSAWMVGERKGLYLVSYISYATKEEALENLATVKKDNPKAWIVRK